MAQPSLLSIVSCSAQCHLLSAVFLGPCYLLPSVSPAAHFRSLHPAPLSPQREHQLIPVPRTESSRWQALSTLLGVRVVGEASVSHLERGSPLLWSSGSLTRLSPTRSVCLRARRTRKTGNGGDGHRSEQGANGVTAKDPPTGLGGSFISRLVSKLASWCWPGAWCAVINCDLL